MILVKENNSGEFDEKTAMPQFLRMLLEEAAHRSRSPIERTRGRISPANMAMLFSHFGNIRILALPQPQSSHREWKAIRKQILDESESVCVERSKAQYIFSATHLTSLFSFACDHFCGDVVRPFNFIRASRLPSPVPKNMSTHLSEFMSQVDSVRLHTFAVPIIASALALDAYPPEMHIFNPRAVFDELYKQICQGIRYHRSENAEENAFDTVQLTNAIEHQFCQNVLAIAEGKTSAAAAHQSCLYYFREEWAQIRSATTCFGCVVARRPEHTCSCGHTFCDLCLVNYGRGAPGAPWTISIKLCPLCDVEVNKVVKIKPPTAGVRVFTADGGGVRGVVGIRWLKVLESNLHLPMPIQEHFDLVVGTSSGGLTGWGLSGEGWSVEECDNKYETLSGVAFHTGLPPQLHSIGVIQMIRHVIVSCTTGSRYSSSGIKKAICSSFGEDAVLFGNATSTKIAITATTTDKSSTVIFTNYNGPQRPVGCGYTTPSGKDAQDMKVWECPSDFRRPPILQTI
ncbi:hypothetical protein V496_02280 [Pseudogymnoascus sp. VKM F-4515 (FW-2607)]|nr:hypothetical protein V496_02280 [Pseudogymnoascus sp. VKM F-4515 (FW-2607)]